MDIRERYAQDRVASQALGAQPPTTTNGQLESEDEDADGEGEGDKAAGGGGREDEVTGEGDGEQEGTGSAGGRGEVGDEGNLRFISVSSLLCQST